MNTIKIAAGCAIVTYCDAAYDLWGASGVFWSLAAFAGIIIYYNRRRRTHDA